jgi:hypothetical protein
MNPELLQKLRAELRKPTSAIPEEPPARTSEMALRAALRSRFTVADIIEDAVGPQSNVNEELAALLALCEPASYRQGPPAWEMNDVDRRECFQSFFAQCDRDQARFAAELRRRLPAADSADDHLQRMIGVFIRGEAAPLPKQTTEELAATQRITGWLDGLLPGLRSLEAIRTARKHSELIAPFRVLAKTFRGRKNELLKLRDYVEWLPPHSTTDVVRRGLRSLVGHFIDLETKPALLLHGMGGAGKTTIVAQFILEHLDPDQGQLPFIYIDFDQPAVSLREPLTFLMEAARQLALQFPETADELNAFRAQCQDEMAYNADGLLRGGSRPLRRGSRFRGSQADETSDTLGEFLRIWTERGPEDRPLLLVLDSFEEAQTRNASLLPGLFSLLQEWAGRIPRFRVVVAGRAEVTEFKTETVEVGELDLEAAIGFLQSHGVASEELAKYIAGRFARNPLTLQLAAAVAVREGAAAHDILDSVQVRNWFGARVDAFRVQQELVRRNLTHLHHEDVEKLAMPGLVVRRVTPEIILEVLAGPCRLEGLTIDGSREVFEKLKNEVSIVMQADPDGSVRYLTPLRRELLPLVKKEEPERSRAIHDAAVLFYERRDDAASRAEEIYHRLSRGDEPSTVSSRIIPGIEDYLDGALGELPAAAHAFLATRFGWPVPEEIKNEAELSDWEEAEAMDLQSAFGSGAISSLESSARRLEARPKRTARSPLYPLEAILYERLGQFPRAMQSAKVAFATVEKSESAYQGWALLMTMGRLAGRLGDWPLACSHLRKAMTVGHRLKHGEFVICAGVELLRAIGRVEGKRFPHTLFRRAAKMPANTGDVAPELDEDIAFSLATSVSEIVQTRDIGENPDGWRAGVLSAAAFDSLVKEVLERAGDDERLGQLTLDVFKQRYRQIGRLPGTIAVKAFDVVQYAETTFSVDELRSRLVPNPQPAASVSRASFAGVEMREMHNAILGAFTHEELDQMLTFEFNKRLNTMVPTGPFNSEVFNLLLEFQKLGLEREFLIAAYRERPANPVIQGAYSKARLAPGASIQQAGETVSTALTQATDAGIEKILRERSPYLNVSVWHQKLSEVSAQVCQILSQGRPLGTGFLVGPDLVLTAYHLVEHADAESNLACRFDYRVAADSTVFAGITVPVLQEGWLVDYSSYAQTDLSEEPTEILPGENQLDYALLRLERRLAEEPLTQGAQAPDARHRGFLPLPDIDPEVILDASLLILQYPRGQPLKVAMDTSPALAWNANGTRLRYRTQTEAGSSGAPCFDFEWNLLALHHAGRPAYSEAVPIAAIRRRLADKGLLPLLPPGSPTAAD